MKALLTILRVTVGLVLFLVFGFLAFFLADVAMASENSFDRWLHGGGMVVIAILALLVWKIFLRSSGPRGRAAPGFFSWFTFPAETPRTPGTVRLPGQLTSPGKPKSKPELIAREVDRFDY